MSLDPRTSKCASPASAPGCLPFTDMRAYRPVQAGAREDQEDHEDQEDREDQEHREGHEDQEDREDREDQQ